MIGYMARGLVDCASLFLPRTDRICLCLAPTSRAAASRCSSSRWSTGASMHFLSTVLISPSKAIRIEIILRPILAVHLSPNVRRTFRNGGALTSPVRWTRPTNRRAWPRFSPLYSRFAHSPFFTLICRHAFPTVVECVDLCGRDPCGIGSAMCTRAIQPPACAF